VIASRRPWSHAMVRSTGFAGQGSIPTPVSPPCWAILPMAAGRSLRPTPTPRLLAAICATPWFWRPLSETSTGCVALIDFMAPGERSSHLVRIVAGVRGSVAMRAEFNPALRLRSDDALGTRTRDKALLAVAGADMAVLRTRLPCARGHDHGRRLHRLAGRANTLRPFLWPLAVAQARSAGRRGGLAATRRYWRPGAAPARSGPLRGSDPRSLLTSRPYRTRPPAA